MDWDEIARKLREFDDLAKRLSMPPFHDLIAQQQKFFEVAAKFDEPAKALLAQQREFDDMVRRLSFPLEDVFERFRAMEQQWQTLAESLDVRLPDRVLASLRVTLDDATLEARAEVGEVSTEPGGGQTEGQKEPLQTVAAGQVLEQARQVLQAAKNRKLPLNTRIALVSVFLSLLALVQSAIQQRQNDAGAEKNTRVIAQAIRQSGQMMVDTLERLQQRAQRDGEHRAVLLRQAPLRRAPSSRSPRLADLPVGHVVSVLHHSGSWLLVETVLVNGSTVSGWTHIQNLALRFQE